MIPSEWLWKFTSTGIEVGETSNDGRWIWWTNIPYDDWPKDALSGQDVAQFVVQYFMSRWPAEVAAA